jgi:hypothetical protein
MSDVRNAEMERCTEECGSCHDVCLAALAYCLHRGGTHADAAHLTMLLDCVDMCRTAANFLLRHSIAHRRTCELCADICDLCAESCAGFPDDETMNDCAETCISCAAACRDMVRSTVRM